MQPSPEPSAPLVPTEVVRFRTDDGVELVGDIAVPATPRGAAIICHPHPSYGGNRFDHVVGALFDALPARGVAALRFDFRQDFGGGVAEAADAIAAIEFVRRAAPDVPVLAVGYSFGAMVALAVDGDDGQITGKLLVAPPLSAMDPVEAPDLPTLVITPAHDQFTPPAAAEPIVAAWPDAELVTVPMADHFLHGGTARVVDLALPWIDRILG
ncbi:MAG: hypothetical protein QNM02_01535 [Acidimicrobiia bacterium]|nr:hypothetical protein [Acidimicrobiia bacterium]